jgi:hypothetical protein
VPGREVRPSETAPHVVRMEHAARARKERHPDDIGVQAERAEVLLLVEVLLSLRPTDGITKRAATAQRRVAEVSMPCSASASSNISDVASECTHPDMSRAGFDRGPCASSERPSSGRKP